MCDWNRAKPLETSCGNLFVPSIVDWKYLAFMFAKSLVTTTMFIISAFLFTACDSGDDSGNAGDSELRSLEFVPGPGHGPCEQACEMDDYCGLQSYDSCLAECDVVKPQCMPEAMAVINCKRFLTCEELSVAEEFCGDTYIDFGVCNFGMSPE